MKKVSVMVGVIVFSLCITAQSVSAHVVVRPRETLTATYQTFTVSVPNEKDIPTTVLRLVIPEGLKSVSPNVKPGWSIEIKKTGEGEETKVSELIWTGGSIPTDQRDEFLFSAQMPATETSLVWKAYQTYADGTVISWDQDAYANDHEEENPNVGPYSETVVKSGDSDSSIMDAPTDSSSNSASFYLSILALGIAGASLFLQFNRRN